MDDTPLDEVIRLLQNQTSVLDSVARKLQSYTSVIKALGISPSDVVVKTTENTIIEAMTYCDSGIDSLQAAAEGLHKLLTDREKAENQDLPF